MNDEEINFIKGYIVGVVTILSIVGAILFPTLGF